MSTSIRHYFKYIKNGIPIELFQILKDDAVKVLHSICQQIWKTQQWPQNWEDQFSFQSQRKAMPKNAQTFAQLHCSHRLLKSCLKFSKPGFNSTWTLNFQMFKLDLEKAEKPEIKLPTSVGSSKKQESYRKTSIYVLLNTPMFLVDHDKLWIFIKRWEYQTTLLPLEKSVCRSRSNS